MKEFDVLAQIGRTSSTNAKQELLRQHDSPVLRNLLLYCYDPFRTYRIKKIDWPDSFNMVQPNVSTELFALLDLLATHTVTPTESRGMLKRLLAKCSEEGGTWIAKIVDRDLKIGISATTINKVFPKLVPQFKCQLALPMVEFSKGIEHWDDVKYPCCGDIKVDGMRVIAVCNGETVTFFSREGHEITTLDHLIPQILKLRPGTKFVLDGESIGIVYNPNCKTAKKNYEAGKNWQFAQGLSMTRSELGSYPKEEMEECLGYIVWDVIDYLFFVSQGAEGVCKPLRYRKTELAGLFERLTNPLKSIRLMENRIIPNKAAAIDFFKEARAADEEGILLKDLDKPYEFKRSNAEFKVKEFYTADLRVIDCEEGGKGTKNEGSLGSIVVSDGKITGKLMGGWDADEGLDMWFRYKRGEFVGSIVELMYMEVTADNSLRHAVFVRERPDKTEISWG